MLKAVNVYKNYGDVSILKGINLEVKKNEVVSIMGASGAGKSTLLHLLGTLDKPDQGDIYLDNKNLVTLKGKALAKFRNQKIGFIFQFHNLLNEFTVLENICLPTWIKQEKKNKTTLERANWLLEILGIDHRKKHLPNQISGGEQQRVAVARALINEPQIILADEPSGNLDSKNTQQLHELFLKLRQDLNQTFVVVTHNQELANISDRILKIKDGIV